MISITRAPRFGTVVAAVGLAAMVAAAAPAGADRKRGGCTRSERADALRQDQKAVLDLVGKEHRKLDDPAEVAALTLPKAGTAYNFFDHQFASARDMGVGVVDTASEGVSAGKPDVLFYEPYPKAAEEAVTEPYVPDFPYELVGWAYASGYNPKQHPAELGDCIVREDWFVHERSIHPADTWQNVAVPPEERGHGQAVGGEPILPTECDPSPCPPGVQHSRLWDIHIWLDDDDVPRVSLLNPVRSIRGWDPGVGVSFFYPDD